MGNFERNKTITVIGLGYIGLPTATLFAAAGFQAFGYEKNGLIVDALMEGKPHIHFQEADLRGLLQSVLLSGNLQPTKEIMPSDFFIICVPTPSKPSGDRKVSDLSFVVSAAKEVAKVLQKGNTVILESTVPPGTTEKVMGRVLEEDSGLSLNKDFHIAHCPERVIPGRILQELRHNDRVIGANSTENAQMVRELYETIVTGGKIHTTDLITAEMCKLVENTYRDVNIALANELSMICDRAGINAQELITLANHHPRVNILSPGPGVGGHCIAVDPWFIVESFPEETTLIKTARRVNDNKTEWIAHKIIEEVTAHHSNNGITIGILGLAYKADVDDVRESPALKLALLLREEGFNVMACEPNINRNSVEGFENLSLKDILEKADHIVLAVAHRQFLDAKQKIASRPCFDAVGVLR